MKIVLYPSKSLPAQNKNTPDPPKIRKHKTNLPKNGDQSNFSARDLKSQRQSLIEGTFSDI